jgi:SAM-dependent methyltransferase/uncharacterized protein YbaR (Trm112 family)
MEWPRGWLEEHLACPYDGRRLAWSPEFATCHEGHRFPIVHGVPVLMRSDVDPTHHLWRTTPADIARFSANAAVTKTPAPGTVDPFVDRWLVGTCGNLFRTRTTPLPRYPIPTLRLDDGDGRLFLDVGSNWGRWSLAAARRGFCAVAVDPSLEAVLAGSRVARQLGLPVAFVVGDARHLPFVSRAFDVTFSYSVLQHLAKDVVRAGLGEIGRGTRINGHVYVQMANFVRGEAAGEPRRGVDAANRENREGTSGARV